MLVLFPLKIDTEGRGINTYIESHWKPMQVAQTGKWVPSWFFRRAIVKTSFAESEMYEAPPGKRTPV